MSRTFRHTYSLYRQFHSICDFLATRLRNVRVAGVRNYSSQFTTIYLRKSRRLLDYLKRLSTLNPLNSRVSAIDYISLFFYLKKKNSFLLMSLNFLFIILLFLLCIFHVNDETFRLFFRSLQDDSKSLI